MLLAFIALAAVVKFLIPKGWEGIDLPIRKASESTGVTASDSGTYIISDTVTESTWTWRTVIAVGLILVGVLSGVGRK